jgi:hypothetical protein
VLIEARGGRSATLLPGIEGIRTVEQQLGAVRRKAGIRPDEPVIIYRYSVKKLSE